MGAFYCLAAACIFLPVGINIKAKLFGCLLYASSLSTRTGVWEGRHNTNTSTTCVSQKCFSVSPEILIRRPLS